MKCAIKYAPQNLSDVIYPTLAVETRIQAYASKGMEGHVLLWGPNGTGKTTVASLLPKAIDGDDAVVDDKEIHDLLRMNDLHAYLQNACHIAELQGGSKLFLVFNEFDATSGNFAKLWTALDKLADRIMLIATTNNAMNIHKSIRSRCDLISFPKLTARQVLPRAKAILQAEGVSIPDQQLLHYLKAAESFGDLRDYTIKIDEIIYLASNGKPLPPAPMAKVPHQPSLTVVACGR